MNGILVLAGALGGGTLAALVTEIFRRPKQAAETDELSAKAVDIITKTAVDLVERSTLLANQREQKLEAKITILESKVDHLSTVIDALSEQLESAGLTPIIQPNAG